MSDSNVLSELRAWRDEFARSHDYVLGAMAQVLREMDATAGARIVRGEPRRPSTGSSEERAELESTERAACGPGQSGGA